MRCLRNERKDLGKVNFTVCVGDGSDVCETAKVKTSAKQTCEADLTEVLKWQGIKERILFPAFRGVDFKVQTYEELIGMVIAVSAAVWASYISNALMRFYSSTVKPRCVPDVEKVCTKQQYGLIKRQPYPEFPALTEFLAWSVTFI